METVHSLSHCDERREEKREQNKTILRLPRSLSPMVVVVVVIVVLLLCCYCVFDCV